MDKNYTQLKSFRAYCTLHPEQRFWQALRNWNQIENPSHNFILTAEINKDPGVNFEWVNEEDTFYK